MLFLTQSLSSLIRHQTLAMVNQLALTTNMQVGNGEKVFGPQGVADFDFTSIDAWSFTLTVAADAQSGCMILFSG